MKKIASVFVLVCCAVFGLACSLNFNARTRSAAADSSTASNPVEDFAREFHAQENMSVYIENVSGDIIVRGADTNRISVRGIKEGRDRAQIRIEDRSNDDEVNVKVHYDDCRNCKASVRFEIEVPRGMRLRYDRLSTASGNVQVKDVTGVLEAKSASGNVQVENVNGKVEATSASGNVIVRDVSGEVNAKTASGNVEASIKQLTGDGDMNFSTASGNVEVALPSETNADVELKTVSGTVKTDFPIEVRRPQYGPGESAEGTLGNGGRDVKLSTVSGNVTLVKS